MSDNAGEWTWELSSNARDDLDALTGEEQDRILDKLDEVVDSPWRDSPDYGEPLTARTGRTVSVSSASP
jgi:mRNA-degrading endonuclease RelE of RelBE toxin-antitoxin system